MIWSAREISALITELTQWVEEGAQLSGEAGSALKQILAAAEETAARIAEIAAATVHQATVRRRWPGRSREWPR